VRYGLPVAAPPVFLLTSGQKARLSIGCTTGEPAIACRVGVGTTQAFEAYPIEHRVRTDQCFGPSSESSGFAWSCLNRRGTGAQDEGSRLQKRRPGFAGQAQSALDARLGQVHVLLTCVQQCQGLHEQALDDWTRCASNGRVVGRASAPSANPTPRWVRLASQAKAWNCRLYLGWSNFESIRSDRSSVRGRIIEYRTA
jgi:hypothetical protein